MTSTWIPYNDTTIPLQFKFDFIFSSHFFLAGRYGIPCIGTFSWLGGAQQDFEHLDLQRHHFQQTCCTMQTIMVTENEIFCARWSA